MSDTNQPANVSETYRTSQENPSSESNFTSLFSGKNLIILILLLLVILSLIGINLLLWTGNVVGELSKYLGPAFKDYLAMLGFTTGAIINGSADLVANTAGLGLDVAKGATHSIGDLLIHSSNPGIDGSKQTSLSEVIGVPKFKLLENTPQPVQSSEPTVTPIVSQKPMAGWCHVGDFSGLRGCVEVSEHDKCMSGQIFASQSKCLNPDTVEEAFEDEY
jgi:hypothetical protein